MYYSKMYSDRQPHDFAEHVRETKRMMKQPCRFAAFKKIADAPMDEAEWAPLLGGVDRLDRGSVGGGRGFTVACYPCCPAPHRPSFVVLNGWRQEASNRTDAGPTASGARAGSFRRRRNRPVDRVARMGRGHCRCRGSRCNGRRGQKNPVEVLPRRRPPVDCRACNRSVETGHHLHGCSMVAGHATWNSADETSAEWTWISSPRSPWPRLLLRLQLW